MRTLKVWGDGELVTLSREAWMTHLVSGYSSVEGRENKRYLENLMGNYKGNHMVTVSGIISLTEMTEQVRLTSQNF